MTLVLPEVSLRHTGVNIPEEVLQVIDTFEIRNKIGCFTLDDAGSNDTAMEAIGVELGFDRATRRGRCVDSPTASTAVFKIPRTPDVVLDNDTRWLSQYYMMKRGFTLRPYIEMLIPNVRHDWDATHRTKQGRTKQEVKEPVILQAESQLTDHDWEVLKLRAEILKFYEDALKILEGDGLRRVRQRG
ncbi:hypothetical protein DL769_003087 [Monosporascus sp. CRB-8-3]|nr:hypothetical protein DL769_003087 [Monosporascus sp. CRB-8-3]